MGPFRSAADCTQELTMIGGEGRTACPIITTPSRTSRIWETIVATTGYIPSRPMDCTHDMSILGCRLSMQQRIELSYHQLIGTDPTRDWLHESGPVDCTLCRDLLCYWLRIYRPTDGPSDCQSVGTLLTCVWSPEIRFGNCSCIGGSRWRKLLWTGWTSWGWLIDQLRIGDRNETPALGSDCTTSNEGVEGVEPWGRNLELSCFLFP